MKPPAERRLEHKGTNMVHASKDRRFVQTAGLAFEPVEQMVLNQLYAMDKAHITPNTSRVLICNANGDPIAAVDFTPDYLAPITAVAEQVDSPPTAEPAPPRQPGDTLIRKIDADEAARIMDDNQVKFSDRPDDPPPTDLDVYQPPKTWSWGGTIEFSGWQAIALVVLVAIITAAAFTIAASKGLI